MMAAFYLLGESRHAFAALAGIFGLMVGSFLNVVVYRLPLMLEREWSELAREQLGLPPAPAGPRFNLMLPHSACPRCSHRIRAWENVPVLSYIGLRGKCSSCKAPISARYPLVEIATCVISAVVAWHFGIGSQAIFLMVLTWGMLAMSLIDIDHHQLPDSLVLPLLWVGLIINCYGLITSLHSAVIGAVVGYMALWGMYWAFKLATGKEGLGRGDFKLLAMIGAWGGWGVIPFTLLLSAVLCVLVSVALMAAKKSRMDAPVAYGPYLTVAGWISLVWGAQISAAFPQLIGV